MTTIIGSDKCRYATYDVQFQISNVLGSISSLWIVNKGKFYFLESGRLTLATSINFNEERKKSDVSNSLQLEHSEYCVRTEEEYN